MTTAAPLSGMGPLVRRAGAVAVARMASEGAAFGTGILLAWGLSRELNGFFQKGWLVARMAALLGVVGIPTAVYYLLPRLAGGERRRLAAVALGVAGIVAAVIAALVAGAAPQLAAVLGNPGLAPLVGWGALFVLVALPSATGDALLVASGRAGAVAVISIACSAAQLLAVGALVFARVGAGGSAAQMLAPVAWALAGAAAVRLVLLLAVMPAAVPRGAGGAAPRELAARMAAYALPVAMVGVLDTCSLWLDRTLVAMRFGESDLAVYSYGAIEIPFLSILTGAILPVLLPEMSARLRKGDRAAALDLWRRAALKAAPLLFGLLFVFLWTAPHFLAAVYSEKYRASAPFFRIYLAMLPLRVVAYMPVLYAMGRNRTVLAGAAGELALNIFLSLFLMGPCGLGMAGAAWGMVIATWAQVAFYLRAIRHGMGARWADLLPWRRLNADFAGAAVWFAPLAASAFAPPEWKNGVFAASVLLFAVYARLRVVPRFTGA